MNLFKECIAAIKRRPFILSFFFVFSLIWSYFEQFFYSLYKRYLAPSVSEFLSYFNVFTDVEPEKIIPPGEMLSEQVPNLIPSDKILPTILLVLLSIVAISAIVSFFVSGYSHVLNISLTDKEKASNEFINGVVKHYFKFIIYISVHLLLSIILFFVLMLATLPSIFSLKLILQGGYSDLILSTIFIIIVSVIAILFVAIIFLMYTAYIYPALTNFKKGALYMSRKIVNSYFGALLPKFLLFMVLIIGWTFFLFAFEFGTLTFPATMAIFILNTLFKSTVVFLFVFYLFSTFKKFKDRLQESIN